MDETALAAIRELNNSNSEENSFKGLSVIRNRLLLASSFAKFSHELKNRHPNVSEATGSCFVAATWGF